ncbi:MAG TPA: cystathionine gamma-synthase family protein [Acidimicrobiia bacterium]|jgi:methionine-gamma-lyase|nr:cystathionine gamma-synthase family protein [Acidimicrobiia bacterium]
MKDHMSDALEGRKLRPESLMMSYGYRPEWSEGALKSPIFQTSTFVFETAEEGKRFFEIATGQRECDEGEQPGMIYSRLNNPDLEILEDRLTRWEDADCARVFASGMAAIATTLLAHLRPGMVLLHSGPLYGGTDHLVKDLLPEMGIATVEYLAHMSRSAIEARLAERAPGKQLGMIFMETPANPTNDLFDIAEAVAIARDHTTEDLRPLVIVDNTFLGPVWQSPLAHGADASVYSCTKYIGGHSDLVAGAIVGSHEAVDPVGAMRTYLGTMATPLTGWLLMRSLETLAIRMERQTATAQRIARFLTSHPKVHNVHYLGLLDAGDPGYDIYKRQCTGPGAMISFEVDDGEAGAFRFLNHLELVRLAVSLGSTESLAEHPGTMTHSSVDPEGKLRLGITPSLVRLSVGVEHPADLVVDLGHALDAV